ncbi:hypothetical protein [Nonomuraea sp. NPDC049028]|uniref:hypothetical protein n=1 Tax=Nonomuraea sp. NPDC049028 TaxID=3364348 RepID=UPI00371CF229
MTRLTDRLGPASLLIALLAIFLGLRLTQDWVRPGLGVIAAALAWPGVRKQATIATVYNRSTSVAGMSVAAVAIGLSAAKLASTALFSAGGKGRTAAGKHSAESWSAMTTSPAACAGLSHCGCRDPVHFGQG